MNATPEETRLSAALAALCQLCFFTDDSPEGRAAVGAAIGFAARCCASVPNYREVLAKDDRGMLVEAFLKAQRAAEVHAAVTGVAPRNAEVNDIIQQSRRTLRDLHGYCATRSNEFTVQAMKGDAGAKAAQRAYGDVSTVILHILDGEGVPK